MLTVSKNCNHLLSVRIVQLERNAVNNAQYHRRESLEINLVPASFGDNVLKSRICEGLSPTGHEVKRDDLQACHRLKKKDAVIVKFKCRKEKCSILINRKDLCNKSDALTQLNFFGRLFVFGSMCHENQHYLIDVEKWKMLARFIPRGFGITQSMLNLMKEVNLQGFKPTKFLWVDNLDEFINNTIFNNLTDLIIFCPDLFPTFPSNLT